MVDAKHRERGGAIVNDTVVNREANSRHDSRDQ